jgi:hypothetical protein
MDLQHWTQRALRIVRLNLSATTAQGDYLLALAADVNGYSIRLYSYDQAADAWEVDNLIDPLTSGEKLWG